MSSPFLLLPEIAEETRTPLSTVRHWISTGRLPSIRPGRRRLVRRSDLEAFLARVTPSRVERRTERDVNAKQMPLPMGVDVAAPSGQVAVAAAEHDPAPEGDARDEVQVP